MKEQVGEIDGTPKKRMYWSIISDYSLETALAELIDNAIDNWSKAGRRSELVVELTLNSEDQSIVVDDNAGGVPELDHPQLISPGLSSNDPSGISIGVFGVGSKRAVVALAKNIRIQTRHGSGKTFQFDIDEQWFLDSTWLLPKFEAGPISQSSTRIELSRLRIPITPESPKSLSDKLGATYARFLSEGRFRLLVNHRIVKCKLFDRWSFPPNFEPICVRGKIQDSDGETTEYAMTAGLVDTDAFKNGECGVYFYCNDRLIAQAVQDPEVGFVRGQAGVPHGEAALARLVCEFRGPAKSMPWNSFKTGINYHHRTYRAVRDMLIEKMSYFASLSRRLAKHKETEVFAFNAGKVRDVAVAESKEMQAIPLPPLPKVRKDRVEHLLTANRTLIREKPWTLGLVESVAAVEIISRLKTIQTKNRIALLLLDSAFEIGLKEFLVHQKKEEIKEADLQKYFRVGGRPEAWKKVKELLLPETFGVVVETNIEHLYRLRNKLVHQLATTEPTAGEVESARDAVERVLTRLFEISFAEATID